MDKRELETILSDQKEELVLKQTQHFCQREEDKIDINSPQAQVVIGVRRSGKSTLCYNALMRKGVKFAYVNFDDERLVNLKSADLNDVLEVLYKINGDFNYLFIDEIQNIPEWYLFVNRLLRRQMHVIITGSNAKLLSGELATHLTGRHHSITLYPFSFAEYCDVRNVDVFSKSTRAVAAIKMRACRNRHTLYSICIRIRRKEIFSFWQSFSYRGNRLVQKQGECRDSQFEEPQDLHPLPYGSF